MTRVGPIKTIKAVGAEHAALPGANLTVRAKPKELVTVDVILQTRISQKIGEQRHLLNIPTWSDCIRREMLS